MLAATVALVRGPLELTVDLQVADREVLAVLGPNGAGKTTLLRSLAGLQPIERGRIALGDAVLDDPQAGRFVAPEAREVGVVFQDYLLFEHMSALDNVAFGLRARGASRAQARQRATRWLERFGLLHTSAARPGALSGGQQQRVALARALAIEPKLLLLDEPLAALDAETRTEVRRELRDHLREYQGAGVLVTHDPLDAYALADRVVVLERGRITQQGTLAAIAAQPRSRYVAQLVGTNLVSGTIERSVFTTESGATLTVDAALCGPAYAAIAPSAIALYRTPPDGSPRNIWASKVAEIDRALDRARVTLGEPLALTAELTSAGLDALGCRPGDAIWASVKATEIATYPA